MISLLKRLFARLHRRTPASAPAPVARISPDARRRLLAGASLAALAAAGALLPAAEAEAQLAKTRVPQFFADVTRFGADPTGTRDSTAAFLAAEASFPGTLGGVVFMPPGTYLLSGTSQGVNFQRIGTSLIGSGSSNASSPNGVSCIYAPNITNPYNNSGPSNIIGAPGNNYGSTYANFCIQAPALTAGHAGFINPTFNGVICLNPGGFARECVFQNVVCEQGDVGFCFVDSLQCTLLECEANGCATYGLVIWGQGVNINSFNGEYHNGATGILVTAHQNNVRPYSCHFYGQQDENGNSHSMPSLWFASADDCGYHDSQINTYNSSDTIRIGETYPATFVTAANGGICNNISITNVSVWPYDNMVRTPTSTINVTAAAFDTKLTNIRTNPGSGTDILDLGVRTSYNNVNGQSSLGISPPINTATISGTPAAGDTVAITFTNSRYASLPVTKTYTVQSGDTTASIATGLAALINADATLSSYNVAAVASTNTIAITQLGTAALSTVLSATTGHGSGGTEAVAFLPSNGHLVNGAPTTANFASQSGSGAAFPANIPLGFMVDSVDGRLYFLGTDGAVHYVGYT